LIPEYNSLSKASALKVNTALRSLAALSLQGERRKNPRNVSKLLRELSSGMLKNGLPNVRLAGEQSDTKYISID
jgi:hypothetical protein